MGWCSLCILSVSGQKVGHSLILIHEKVLSLLAVVADHSRHSDTATVVARNAYVITGNHGAHFLARTVPACHNYTTGLAYSAEREQFVHLVPGGFGHEKTPAEAGAFSLVARLQRP